MNKDSESDYVKTECSYCHENKPCTYTYDPFLAEIHEDFTSDWYCEDCLYDRSMEI